jgi:integrase
MVWAWLTSILIAAGLPHGPKDKFHKIRKTTASHIAKAAGASMASAVLGHSDVEVTKRYIDPTIAGSNVDATSYLPRLEFRGNGRKDSH